MAQLKRQADKYLAAENKLGEIHGAYRRFADHPADLKRRLQRVMNEPSPEAERQVLRDQLLTHVKERVTAFGKLRVGT